MKRGPYNVKKREPRETISIRPYRSQYKRWKALAEREGIGHTVMLQELMQKHLKKCDPEGEPVT